MHSVCTHTHTHTHTHTQNICALKILKPWGCRISSHNLLKTLLCNIISKGSLQGHINQLNQNHFVPESLNSMQITCKCVTRTTMSQL